MKVNKAPEIIIEGKKYLKIDDAIEKLKEIQRHIPNNVLKAVETVRDHCESRFVCRECGFCGDDEKCQLNSLIPVEWKFK